MAPLVASPPVAVLNHPKLCQAPLGEILHALLHPVHHLDCRLLLLDGLDGECSLMSLWKPKTYWTFRAFTGKPSSVCFHARLRVLEMFECNKEELVLC